MKKILSFVLFLMFSGSNAFSQVEGELVRHPLQLQRDALIAACVFEADMESIENIAGCFAAFPEGEDLEACFVIISEIYADQVRACRNRFVII